MPHQITVTAKTGPDRQVTAVVLPNVTNVNFDLNDKVLQINQDNQSSNQIKEYELASVTTVTCTVTSGNYAFVVS